MADNKSNPRVLRILTFFVDYPENDQSGIVWVIYNLGKKSVETGPFLVRC